MQTTRTFTIVILAAIPLAACASAGDEYPSLAIRDAERQTGTFAPAIGAAAAPVQPAPPAPELLDRLAQLRAEAQSAHRAFAALAPAARRRVNAARGAGVASDVWAAAQVAISELDARRSQTAIPMADLDELLVSQAVALQQNGAATQAQAEVQALLEEEDRLLQELKGALAR